MASLQYLISQLPSLRKLKLNAEDLVPTDQSIYIHRAPEKGITNSRQKLNVVTEAFFPNADFSEKDGTVVAELYQQNTSLMTQNPQNMRYLHKPFDDFPIKTHVDAIYKYVCGEPNQQPKTQMLEDRFPAHTVLAIKAPTGTGKTLRLPWEFAAEGWITRVAIPNTVATRTAYEYIKNRANFSTGFAAAREIQYRDNTQLVYATTGHYVKRLINLIKKGKIDYARKVFGQVFVVDEIHNGTVDITTLLGLISYLFRDSEGKYVGPKLIFTTATLDASIIKNFFMKETVQYAIDLQHFPVEIYYEDKETNPLRENIDKKVVNIINNEIKRWTSERSAVWHGLIFRPGVQEVITLIEYLEYTFRNVPYVEFFPAYSGLSQQDIDAIFTPSNKMKIIVGTNIIESSVTIKDVGFVIDDLLEKIAETSSTGGKKLTLKYITQSAAEQRKGRTGRTRSGRNYRLCTKKFFDELPNFRVNEIDRIPIYGVVLSLIDANLSPLNILKINDNRYHQAINILIDKGMLVRSAESLVIGDVSAGVNLNKINEYTVTDIGTFVSSLSINIYSSLMIYQALDIYKEARENVLIKYVVEGVIALGCMIEHYDNGFFYIPRFKEKQNENDKDEKLSNEEKQAYQAAYFSKYKGVSDIDTLLNIYWDMATSTVVRLSNDTSYRGPVRNYIKEYSKSNSLNNKKLFEFIQTMRDVSSSLRNIEYNQDYPSIADREVISAFVKKFFRSVYSKNRLYLKPLPKRSNMKKGDTKKYRYIYNPDGKVGIEYSISGSSYCKLFDNPDTIPPIIYAAEFIEVAGDERINHLASIIVDDDSTPEDNEALAPPPVIYSQVIENEEGTVTELDDMNEPVFLLTE